MDFTSKFKEVLNFTVTRLITVLFKNYLMMTEDLYTSHQDMMQKIAEIIPEKDLLALKLVDCFDENKYNYIRKRILDIGNDSLRECQRTFDIYESKEKN